MNGDATTDGDASHRSLADLLPPGMFVGTSLILCREGRFLYGLRPPRPEGERLVADLTGIGGHMEDEDVSLSAGALREAREEMGCAVRLLSCRATLVVRGPGRVERVALAGGERPVAVVYRRYRTPPHQPWHEANEGEACLVVYLAELAGPPRPAMELPALIWLLPAHIVETARRDVPLAELLASGAELLTDPARPLPAAFWLRLTDSQEALALGLGDDAQPFYEALTKTGGRPPGGAMLTHESGEVTLASLGRPIAVGRTAEIYAWREGWVLKLFRRDWDRGDVEHEARVARAVHATGLPVPAVGNIIEVDGRSGLEYARADGPSLLQQFMRQPSRLWASAHLLAELQAEMHTRAAPGLPMQRVRLQRKIQHAEPLPSGLRADVLALLATLPDGDRLCHGDFHPDNVVMTDGGPVVIDWVDASCGNPLADVARTLLLCSLGTPPSLGPAWRLLFSLARREFCRAYLRRYLELRPGGRQELAAWRAVVAAARLQEGIVEENEQLLDIVRVGLGRAGAP